MAIPLTHLDPATKKKALAAAGKKRAPAERKFTAEDERRDALEILAVLAGRKRTQADRARVLRRAAKINEV